MPPGKYYYSSTVSDAPEEYHAFWYNAFSGGESDNSTFLISAPVQSHFQASLARGYGYGHYMWMMNYGLHMVIREVSSYSVVQQ